MKAAARKRIILSAVIAVIFVAGAFGITLAENYIAHHPSPTAEPVADPTAEENDPLVPVGSTDNEPVRFSLAAGFYDSPQKLGLSADEEGEIYYTRDGSDPRTNGRKYRNPITIKSASDQISVYDITAAVKRPDGTFSEPVTRSYITGDNISGRFDCLVFSISIDPDSLYNYDDGIFILGKMRDDYLATNPTREIQPTDPANWNQRGRAGERAAHVDVFEYDGNCVISQDCGLRIFGGWSRANDQKNLKLYARSEYDEVNNRFRYEFFPDASDSQGNKIVSYKKLALRACANDAGYLYARDDAISAMAEATGLEVKKSRPAAVFLNGEYYGFAWLQQVFSEDLLDHKYNVSEKFGVDDGEWDIIKGCEYMMIEDADDPDWGEKNAAWREMYDYAYKDLTDDETFEELSKLLDIDNFLTYYAFNSYVGNGDWPNNNYKVFRYANPVEGGEPIFDGRWRFMLYDTDFALGLYNNGFLTIHMQQLFKEDNFGLFPEDWRDDVHDKGDMYYKRSDMLISLCKRPEIRDKFVTILCDLAGYYLNAERASAYLDEYCTLRLHELVEAANLNKANLWSAASELNNAKDWITKRPYAIRTQMSKVFPSAYDKDGIYNVRCEPADGAVINLSTANIISDGPAFDGFYFNNLEVPLSCTLEDGAEFVRWIINGEEIAEREVTVSKERFGSNIEIELEVEKNSGIKLYEIAYKGSAGGDYIILKNTGSRSAATVGMTVSDGSNEFMIPSMNLTPNAEVKLIGKNYSKMDALGCVELGFNLKEGETVTLKNSDGEIISEVTLRPAHRLTALRLDTYGSEYNEVSCNYKTRLLEAELPTFQWGNW